MNIDSSARFLVHVNSRSHEDPKRHGKIASFGCDTVNPYFIERPTAGIFHTLFGNVKPPDSTALDRIHKTQLRLDKMRDDLAIKEAKLSLAQEQAQSAQSSKENKIARQLARRESEAARARGQQIRHDAQRARSASAQRTRSASRSRAKLPTHVSTQRTRSASRSRAKLPTHVSTQRMRLRKR